MLIHPSVNTVALFGAELCLAVQWLMGRVLESCLKTFAITFVDAEITHFSFKYFTPTVSSFTAVFADSLYVLLYCTVHEFHFHYKALPFSLLVSFIVFFLVIYTSSHVPNLFYTPNFCGAKKRKKMYAKKK